MGSSYWPYAAIVVLIMLSAFFSGSEIAYASANKLRLRKAAENGGLRAKLANHIYENYDKGLTTILVGNNIVNMASSSIATVISMRLVGGGQGAVLATAVMTVIIITFGEVLPKVLARRNVDAFVVGGSPFLTGLMYILWPFIWLFTAFTKLIGKLWNTDANDDYTEDELVSLIETVEDEGVIDEDRSELIQSAIEFSDISVQEIITPRVDMLAIDADDPINEIGETCMESTFSRLPVYEGTIDNIIGILSLNRFFKKLTETEEFSVQSLLVPPCFVHKSMKLPAVLAEMKRRKSHMAIVTDEYGGTMGIVTMEDVLEQIVGDIWDETDVVEEEVTELGPGEFLISGDMGIFDMFEEVEVSDKDFDGDYTTAGGWAIEMLGGYPKAGDSFEYGRLTVTVKEMEDLRIIWLHIKVAPPEEEEE